jgi:hypothetical protein
MSKMLCDLCMFLGVMKDKYRTLRENLSVY